MASTSTAPFPGAATQDWRERNREEINRARREAYGSSRPHRYPKKRASPGKSP